MAWYGMRMYIKDKVHMYNLKNFIYFFMRHKIKDIEGSRER